MQGLIDRALGRTAEAGRISFPAEPLRALDGAMKEDIISKAEAEAREGYPPLPLSLYRDFSRTGNRKRFEDPYFARRIILSDLVIAEAAEGSGRFIPMIEEGIWLLLSEPAWTLPAHNTYIRDTEPLDTPLIERPVLDLFQCETGEILALTVSMLKDSLSPVLVQDAEHALRERILRPYITDHFWWMGSDGPLNNWAPWCTQNVLLSVLTLKLTEKEAGKVLRTAVSTLDEYIASFPDDGGCDEGPHYYHEAALALWGCLEIISRSTGLSLDSVFSSPKMKAMAEYIEKMHVCGGIYLNYADSSPLAGNLTAREYLFGKAVGSRALMHHAALDAAACWRESDNRYNLFYKYLALSYAKEIRAEAEHGEAPPAEPFTALRDTGLAVYRRGGTVFAIKGGHNGESHNHNDAGSIILYRDGRPCLIDLGVGTYTKATFSSERYTLFPMRSTYHNVVNFPPLEQQAGEDFRAITLRMDEEGAAFDLTGAYESGKGLRKYIRTVSAGDTIRITEDFDADMSGVLTLMTSEEPHPEGNAVSFASFCIHFPEPLRIETETLEINDERLRIAWPEKLYRTLVTLPHTIEWTISI